MKKVHIKTNYRNEIIDITQPIQDYIKKQKIKSGVIVVYSPHTTAGISVNENADPDVKKDIIQFLNKTIPEDFGFQHTEGNSDSHIKGSLINFSQTFIINDFSLMLGTWQSIYFMEFDGPRNREFWLKTIS
ncbi:MAG: YjbQ family protein [bacterium]|nr:YjbQ family protein [bacterium]